MVQVIQQTILLSSKIESEAIISAVGDEITLENASALDQYELIATAGQTTFGGVDGNGNSIRDLNDKPIALNGLKVKVFVDGIEQAETSFEEKLDRVVFSSSPTPSGGERVEIVSEFSRLVEEDDPIMLSHLTKESDESLSQMVVLVIKNYQEFWVVIYTLMMFLVILSVKLLKVKLQMLQVLYHVLIQKASDWSSKDYQQIQVSLQKIIEGASSTTSRTCTLQTLQQVQVQNSLLGHHKLVV